MLAYTHMFPPQRKVPATKPAKYLPPHHIPPHPSHLSNRLVAEIVLPPMQVRQVPVEVAVFHADRTMTWITTHRLKKGDGLIASLNACSYLSFHGHLLRTPATLLFDNHIYSAFVSSCNCSSNSIYYYYTIIYQQEFPVRTTKALH